MTVEIESQGESPDWAGIRARYEAGAEKLDHIANEIGLSRITLSLKAKALGWKLRGSGRHLQPATPPPSAEATPARPAKSETTKQTLRRLKDVLQKSLHGLEGAIVEIGKEVKTSDNERELRATNTLVRTLEKVLELEHKERKQRSRRIKDAARLNDAERDELARRVIGLCQPGAGETAEPQTEDRGSAETSVGMEPVGAQGPASATG